MSDNPITIGFIGCGRAAQTVHLPYFATSKSCTVKTLVDKRKTLASLLAAQYGIPQVADDHRVLCDDPEIEAVVVILRESLHAPVSIDLMQAGKHVFTEKPISDRLRDARAMVSAARETERLLMVGYMRRYDPGVEKARSILEDLRASGKAGSITQAHLRSHSGGTPEQAYGAREPLTTDEHKPYIPPFSDPEVPARIGEIVSGTNFFQTHLTDLMLYLLDPVERVSYADMPPDSSRLLFVYDQGPYRTVHTGGGFGRNVHDEQIVIYFEKGRLTIWPSINFLRDTHAQLELVLTGGSEPVIERPIIGGLWCFKAQAEHFIHCLKTGDRPRCTGKDALQDAELMDMIIRRLAAADA